MSYKYFNRLSPMGKIVILMIFWIFFISISHYYLNVYEPKIIKIKMGYMPVVTNISAPILDYVTKDRTDIHLEALKFSSFADMAEAFKQDQIQVAFIIAPLSIVLYDQNIDLSVVYIGNRNESTLVTRSDLNVSDIRDLIGKTIAVPLRYSGHNLFLYKLAYDAHINPKNLDIVEMQPPDMAAALAAGDLDAYCVGEPFAAQTLFAGQSKLLCNVEDKWPGFICNLVILKNQFIKNNPKLVSALTKGFVHAGLWAKNHQNKTIEIAAQYWNREKDVIRFAFNSPRNRICYNQYQPKIREMQQISDMMFNTNLTDHRIIVNGLVDTTLTANIDTANITLENIFVY
jgi:NitT/TauT family transport system substrate-binding protein